MMFFLLKISHYNINNTYLKMIFLLKLNKNLLNRGNIVPKWTTQFDIVMKKQEYTFPVKFDILNQTLEKNCRFI